MTLHQRRVLVVVGSLLALVAAALWLTGSGGGEEERLAVEGRTEHATTTEPRPVSTETTYALFPLTTGLPVPGATEAAPPTSAPSATPADPGAGSRSSPATPSPAVNGDGAVLARPATAAPPRAIDKAKGCNSAADPGWKIEECGALKSNGVVLLWVVESRGKGLRALVLREQTAGQWALVLSAADDGGTAWSSIGVRGEDLTGDGQPELTFGFHKRTPDRVLAVDVVEAPSVVVTLHRDLPRGSARLAKGELATWASSNDTTFEHQRIRSQSGAWRVVATQTVDRGAVPPSMI